jgi:ribosomal protein S6
MYLQKEGRVAKAYRLSQEGLKPKEIAKKMKLDERIVRSYIWRAKNPEKYKELLKRYHEKKKAKQAQTPTTQKE